MKKRDRGIVRCLLLGIEIMTREVRRLLFKKPPKTSPGESTAEGRIWYMLMCAEHAAETIRRELFPEEGKP